MANTINASLIKELLQDSKVVTTLGTRVAPLLDQLSVIVETDPVAPNANINVPVVSSGPTVQTNASNFESGDSTVGLCKVTAVQLTASFHMTNTENNTGYRLRWLIKKAMQQLCMAIVDKILAEVTTTNFGSAVLDSTAANFDSSDLATIWAGGNGKNFLNHYLLLDGDYFAKLLPTTLESFRPETPGAFGFDSILVNNRWTGAGTGVIGFHFDDPAIAVGLGWPALNSTIAKDMLASENVMIEELGIPVQYNEWVARQGRTHWGSLDIMVGADAADTSAGELITNGAS